MCFETNIGTIFKTTVITLNSLPGVLMILPNLTVPGDAHPAGGKIPLRVGRASRSARTGTTATTPSKMTYHL